MSKRTEGTIESIDHGRDVDWVALVKCPDCKEVVEVGGPGAWWAATCRCDDRVWEITAVAQ